MDWYQGIQVTAMHTNLDVVWIESLLQYTGTVSLDADVKQPGKELLCEP